MIDERFKNTVNTEDALFDGDHLTTIQNFPYDEVFKDDEIDRGNPLAAVLDGPVNYKIAGEALARLLEWIWCDKKFNPGADGSFTAATRRFVAVSALLRPDFVNSDTMQKLAKRLGCSRACLSKMVSQFRHEFGGIEFRTGRKAVNREHMRRTRLRQVANGKPSPWAIKKQKEKK